MRPAASTFPEIEERREFLRALARWGAGAAAAPAALAALAERLLAAETTLVEVKHYDKLANKRIHCYVCPLNCLLDDGLTCFCNTRTNHGGTLYTHAFGNPCILRTDPIEKLPLNHFRPGSRTLSLAVGGCNLRCLYCQNWQQSQVRPEELKTWDLPPARAAEGALEGDLDTIALTYTEPVSFLEYALAIAEEARRKKVRVVVASGAFLNPRPMKELAGSVDGMCLALKGITEKFYEDVVGGRLTPVLDAIVAAKETGVWLEVVNLIVPTLNDDPKDLRDLALWVKKNLGTETPLHFARFVPDYKLKNLPWTPIETITLAREQALDLGLKFVYTTNVAPHEGSATSCPKCKTVLVRRVGFKILENRVEGGACPRCKSKLPGVWA